MYLITFGHSFQSTSSSIIVCISILSNAFEKSSEIIERWLLLERVVAVR